MISFQMMRTAGTALLLAAASSGFCSVGVAADEAVELVASLLASTDAGERAIGLERVRYGIKGKAATDRLVALLPTLPTAAQAQLAAALGDRADAAALPAVNALFKSSQDASVRSACIRALGTMGGTSEVPALAQALASADPEMTAARRALTVIGGSDAVAAIVAASKSAAPEARAVLLEVLADRRARAAVPDFLAAAIDSQASVRAAAMRSLGKLGGPDQIPGMVLGFLKAEGKEREEAEKAIVLVCTKNDGKERSAARFMEVFKAANAADREPLLSPLAKIGGNAALEIIDGLIADADTTKRQLGLKTLVKWPDATVSKRILDLVGSARDPAEREILLGGLIRIAPPPDNKLKDNEKLDLLKKAMDLCMNDKDRGRVLERANAIRTVETFRFVLPYLDDPNLAEPACKSIVELAHHRKLRDDNKDDFMKALDRVISTTKNAELIERAERYKLGKTWER